MNVPVPADSLSRRHDLTGLERLRLRDGRTINIRPVRPDDAEQLVEFDHRLSPGSRRSRFFAVTRPLSLPVAQGLTEMDFVLRAAFVASFPGETEIRAVGRYQAESDSAAEIAFVVEDALHGQGIASHLLQHLVAVARANGYRTLKALVLSENSEMLDVFRHSGLAVKMERESATVRVTLGLV